MFTLTVLDNDVPADYSRLMDSLTQTMHHRIGVLEQEMAASERTKVNYPDLEADKRNDRTIVRETALTVKGRRMSIELTITPRVVVTSTGLVATANHLLKDLETVIHDVLDHDVVMAEVMAVFDRFMPSLIAATAFAYMSEVGRQIDDLITQRSGGPFARAGAARRRAGRTPQSND